MVKAVAADEVVVAVLYSYPVLVVVAAASAVVDLAADKAVCVWRIFSPTLAMFLATKVLVVSLEAVVAVNDETHKLDEGLVVNAAQGTLAIRGNEAP